MQKILHDTEERAAMKGIIRVCCGDLVTKSCLTLLTPCTIAYQASLVHGISQARTVEWVAISFSRGFSQPTDQTQVSSCVAGRFFTD